MCEACPPFSDTLGQEGAAVCVCESGWWMLGGACVLCPNGAVQKADTRQCVSCGAGTYAGDIGEGMTCLGCPVGTFSAVAGWTACVACPPYATTSPRGYATACTCVPGALLDYARVDDGCQPCAPGWFQPVAQAPCVPCPAGSFQPALAGTACLVCPNGTDAPSPGLSRCVDCSERVTDDRTACQCWPGFFNSTTAGAQGWACVACLDTCPAGQFLAQKCGPDADAACGPCTAPERACVAGRTYVRQNCTLGRDVVCWPCLPGCVQGWYAAQPCWLYDDLWCKPCEHVQGCAPGQYVARPCSATANTLCLPCPAGAVSQDGRRCTPCAQPGQAAINNTCVRCPKYASPGHDACVAPGCPPGAYPSGPRQCAWCPPGAVSPDGRLCVWPPSAARATQAEGSACLLLLSPSH